MNTSQVMKDDNLLFKFEDVDWVEIQKFTADTWHYSVYVSVFYVGFIHFLKFLMKDREKFELRYVLTLWNLSLSFFSVFSFFRILPDVYSIIARHGLQKCLCAVDLMEVHKPSVFWLTAYGWSKYFELGDTVFIILRKHPLIVLHWFHHCSTLVLSWYVYSKGDVNVGILTLMVMVNLFIHSIMYFYFAMRSYGFKFSKGLSMSITSLQILQLVVGVFLLKETMSVDDAQMKCKIDRSILTAVTLFMGSNLFFFINYYYRTYFKGNAMKEHQNRKHMKKEQ